MQSRNKSRKLMKNFACVALLMLVATGVPSGGASTITEDVLDAASEHACLAELPGPYCGDRLWLSRFDGLAYQDENGGSCVCPVPHKAKDMVISESEGITIVTGQYTTTSAGPYGSIFPRTYWITLGYSSENGDIIWINRISASDAEPFRGGPRDVDISPDGRTAVVAGDGILGNVRSFTTITYDVRTGSELWRVYQPDSPTSNSNRVAIDPAGETVFVTGDRWDSHDSQGRYPTDILTVAYDLEDGTERWNAAHTGSVTNESVADLRVAPDGSKVYVTGTTRGGGVSGDITTVAYDAQSGSETWVASYSGFEGGFDEAVSLDVSSDGSRVFVIGMSYAPDGWGPDVAVIAYDVVDGDMIWESRHRGTEQSSNVPVELRISPDGDSIGVAAYTTDLFSGTSDFLTLLIDEETGEAEWDATYEGPGDGHDRPVGVDFAPDGKHIYVGGASIGDGTDADYAIVSYDAANGDQLWADRYHNPLQQEFNQPSVDVLTSFTVDGQSGRLIVTGNSDGLVSGSSDIFTIAYGPGRE